MKDKMIHLYLWIMIENQMIEIIVSENASFHDILTALKQMNLTAVDWNEVNVIERESETNCDTDIGIAHLNVQNGMVFQVY